MLLPSDLAKPLPGERPAGQDLRNLPLWENIREARREDDGYQQGAWQHERKVADHAAAVQLITKAFAVTRDLQLAAWLTESLLARYSFEGLAEGLVFCRELIENVWADLHPEMEDGDVEPRTLLLDSMARRISVQVRMAPICNAGIGTLAYNDSRKILYEDKATTKELKAARDAAIKEGKVAPEVFDRSFTDTKKAFYVLAQRHVDKSLEALAALEQVCAEKFASDPPNLGNLETALTEVRHVVTALLQKKRATNPDDPEPEEVAPPPVTQDVAQTIAQASGPAQRTATGAAVAMALESATEQPSQASTIFTPSALSGSDPAALTAQAAAALRLRDPRSSAPYLMLRGLRWGELRDSTSPFLLEAPPTEVRQHIKRLAFEGRWAQLLEASETVMAMSYGRAWLDVQRYVVQACTALGDGYKHIATAIRSELGCLLSDLPELLHATLTDDTPAANAETLAWLKELLGESEPRVSSDTLTAEQSRWRKPTTDPQILASIAMEKGDTAAAIEILGREVDQQRSGRSRFSRKVQLARLCLAAGKDSIAQPLLDDLAAAVETHKLEDWEEREFVAGVLTLLLQSSKKVGADAKVKQAMFERVCRLDPVQALSV